MHNPMYHRGVTISLNMQPVVEAMCGHFIRLIDQANTLFLDGAPLGKRIQKRWYSKQLLGKDNQSFGFLYFTVTNRSILKRDFNLDDTNAQVTELEYSFHVKQCETMVHARNFTSGTVRYKNTWGEFSPENVAFDLYGGTDVEHATILRELIKEIKDQMADFNLDSNTLIAQNELDLIPIMMHRG